MTVLSTVCAIICMVMMNEVLSYGLVLVRNACMLHACMNGWMKNCSLQMCTFAPKLNKRPLSEEWAGSVIERSQAWQARRDQKVHEAREQDADKDLQGCTFWSDPLPPPPPGCIHTQF